MQKLLVVEMDMWVSIQGRQWEIERTHPPHTSSKNRLKSFRDLVVALIIGRNFAPGKRMSMKIWL